MFKPYYGKCKGREGKTVGCSNEGWITTNSRQLCATCERKRIASTPLKRTVLKQKFPKKSGQYDVFVEIANERPHVCFVTKTPVNVYKEDGSLRVSCFMHVVSKGSNVALKLHKPNIQIAQPWVHTIYDRGNEQEREEMDKKYPGWRQLLRLHDEILEIYHNTKV